MHTIGDVGNAFHVGAADMSDHAHSDLMLCNQT